MLKHIKKYPDLFASKDGHIYDIRKKRFLKQYKTSGGYLAVYYKGKNLRVHRLVAFAFISNPKNKPHIDHIDTNRQNNHVNNLRWVNPKENSNNSLTRKHHHQTIKRKHKKYIRHARERGKRGLPHLYDWEKWWWFTE